MPGRTVISVIFYSHLFHRRAHPLVILLVVFAAAWGWRRTLSRSLVFPFSPFPQEAARQDPDNSEYRGLIKKYKLMESTKEAGNRAFKANDYDGAIKSWGEALVVDRTNKSFNSKLHCNRAAAYAKVGRWQCVPRVPASHPGSLIRRREKMSRRVVGSTRFLRWHWQSWCW